MRSKFRLTLARRTCLGREGIFFSRLQANINRDFIYSKANGKYFDAQILNTKISKAFLFRLYRIRKKLYREKRNEPRAAIYPRDLYTTAKSCSWTGSVFDAWKRYSNHVSREWVKLFFLPIHTYHLREALLSASFSNNQSLKL